MCEEKISVIVPIYNAELYLDRCLKSIINNTHRNLEIICINDGSTDTSLNILESYKENDSRIIVISQENRGVSSARNKGLEIATGEYISFVDADDMIHPKFFTCLMSIMIESDADIVIGGYSRELKYGTEQKIVAESLSRAQFMQRRDCKGFVWGRIYKKNIITIRFDEKSKIEDADFNAALISISENLKIMYTRVPLYFYFFRAGSLVSKMDGRVCMTFGERLYKYALKEKDNELKQAFVIDSIKRLLAAEYEYRLINEREKSKQCCILEKRSLKLIYSYKEKVKYRFLICARVLDGENTGLTDSLFRGQVWTSDSELQVQ